MQLPRRRERIAPSSCAASRQRGDFPVQPILFAGEIRPRFRHPRISPEGRLAFGALCEMEAVLRVFPKNIRLLHGTHIIKHSTYSTTYCRNCSCKQEKKICGPRSQAPVPPRGTNGQARRNPHLALALCPGIALQNRRIIVAFEADRDGTCGAGRSLQPFHRFADSYFLDRSQPWRQAAACARHASFRFTASYLEGR